MFSVLSTADFKTGQLLTVYPNPAGNLVHIAGEKQAMQWVKIYNLLGQLVQTAENHQGAKDFAIDVSQLQSGNYLIQIGAAEMVSTQRFVKR